MVHLTLAAVLFNTVFFAHCEVPARDQLNLVKNVRTAAAMPPQESITYDVVPGTKMMLGDIAEELETRMRGIVKGPFLVVFDFGGIGAKYFSIIERMSSSGVAAVNNDDGPAYGRVASSQGAIRAGFAAARGSVSSVLTQGGVDSLLQASVTLQRPAEPISTTESLPSSSGRVGHREVQRSVGSKSGTFEESTSEYRGASIENSQIVSQEHVVTSTTATSPADVPMQFTTLANASVNAADALKLYASLKPISNEFSIVIKNNGFNCVRLEPTKIDLKLYVIDNVAFGDGQICGLANLQLGKDGTVTRDAEDIIEITVPLNLKDLTVEIKSIDVNNYFFAVIKGQPLAANVKEISCKGTFSFKRSNFEIVSLRIEWENISGIHIKLDGVVEEGSALSGVVDYLATALSGVIKSFISPVLDDVEKQITKNLLGH